MGRELSEGDYIFRIYFLSYVIGFVSGLDVIMR